jgi:hypothetical protein
VEKDAEKRVKLFEKQLKLFTESINQVSNKEKRVWPQSTDKQR